MDVVVKKEYHLKIWGGAWNSDANPSVEKDLGIKEGSYYFDTKEEFEDFERKLDPYRSQGIASSGDYGYMRHKSTIAKVRLGYKGQLYDIKHNFRNEYPEDSAIYMFTQGNYSCDCNLSLFIREQYGKDVIPELECGDIIKLLDIKIVYED